MKDEWYSIEESYIKESVDVGVIQVEKINETQVLFLFWVSDDSHQYFINNFFSDLTRDFLPLNPDTEMINENAKEYGLRADTADEIKFVAIDKISEDSGSIAKPVEPSKPEKYASLDEWFRYYHLMNSKGFKYSLKNLASNVGFSHGYVRKRHMDWKIENDDFLKSLKEQK